MGLITKIQSKIEALDENDISGHLYWSEFLELANECKIQELEDAIESTICGMEWNRDEHPENFDKSDHEHLGVLKELQVN